MSREATLEKLERILGPARAQQVTVDTMRAGGIADLDHPDSRLKFGRKLAEQGGVLAAIGRAIAIQAILEGADEVGQVPETGGWRY